MIKATLETVLVVGSGSIAKRHIANLLGLFPDVCVVCVSASGRMLDPAEVGASIVETDITAAIRQKPDFAVIASPAPHHLSHADQLLAADIPVLIEKPLCTSLSELDGLDLRRHSAPTGVAYNLRFMPAARVVKELLDDRAVGPISTAFAEVGQFLPDWRPGKDYRKGVSARRELGGGALLELSHELDYLNWFFGPFSQALGVIRKAGSLDINVEDTVDVLLRQREGQVVHVHLDFLQRQPCRRFKAIGATGTIEWDLISNEVCLLSADGNAEQVYADPLYDRNQMYINQMTAFVDFIQGKAGFESSLESSLTVMRLVEAIKVSSKQSAWAEVETES